MSAPPVVWVRIYATPGAHILAYVVPLKEDRIEKRLSSICFSTGKIVRPNIECTNGYIHLVDTVMMDDSPPWTVLAASTATSSPFFSTTFLILLLITYLMQ